MTNSQEVELKFTCGPGDLAAVLAAAPPGDDDTAELISVYFDTPDLALQKAGASLRVRERKGQRVQTLKRGEGMAREEYEVAIEGLAPDPALGPLPKLVPSGASLRPAFNVRVSRRQRLISYQGSEIELAFDQGEVVGGEARAPICEVELELKAGRPESLFALARELSDAAPLYLSFESKASRGQALVAGAPRGPRTSAAVALRGDETVAAAFQITARRALGQIAANAAILRSSPSPEAVHQLRVGVRRFRSALSTFRKALKDDDLETVRAELKWLGQACDSARNLDVFAESLASAELAQAPPLGVAALRKLVAAARRRARAGATEAVASQRFRRLMIDAAAWVETGDWRAHAVAKKPVTPFAGEALKARRKAALKRGRHMDRADDAGLHELRIAVKKLRYASDAFAGLYPTKRVAAFTASVKRLQSVLGELNDLATAGPLVESLALSAEAAFAAGQILGRRMAERPADIARAAKAYERFTEAERYWTD